MNLAGIYQTNFHHDNDGQAKRKWFRQDTLQFEGLTQNNSVNESSNFDEDILTIDKDKPFFLDSLDNSSPENHQSRRKEQNRAAQRAFRERKEKYVKELEIKIESMEREYAKSNYELKHENEELKKQMKSMEADIYTLRGAVFAFEMAANKLREPNVDMSNSNGYYGIASPVSDQHTASSGSEIASPKDHATIMTPQDKRSNTSDSYSPNLMVPNFHMLHTSRVDLEKEDIEDLMLESEPTFAQSSVKRSDHTSALGSSNTESQLISYSQAWERLAQHPKFDEINVEELCQEMRKKAKFTGSVGIIEESEVQKVLDRFDNE